MARKIGDVTIEGDYDGDLALRQAKKNVDDIAKAMEAGSAKAGKRSGGAFADQFTKRFRERLSRVQLPALNRMNRQADAAGTRLGILFTTPFSQVLEDRIRGSVDKSVKDLARLGESGGVERLTARVGGLGKAMEKYSEDLDRAAASGAITRREVILLNKSVGDQIERMRAAGDVTEDYNAVLRRSSERIQSTTKSISRSNVEFTKHQGFLSRVSRGWKGLSHNTRQWTLIIAAIAAALPTLSVLGSAAGGALAVAGNAAGTLVTSLGLAIVGFQGLFAENMKLVEGAEASKVAFQELGQAFKDLQPGIVNAMFDGMASSIQNLTTALLPGIESNLYALSAAVGSAMGSLLDMFSSPEAISIFNGLLEAASSTIGPLLEGIGGLFLGILSVFEQATPLAQSFAGWLQQIGTDFLAWTQSEAGRDRIAVWLQTAERILPLVGELLVSTGQALANLVTPSSIANTEAFLTSISNFMEPLSGLLDILGELDVFGVLATMLNTVGQALAPLQGPLSDLAGLIGDTLKSAIDALGPAFAALAGFLSPIISAVTDFLTPIFERIANDVLPVVVSAFGDVMTALAPVGTAIQGLVDALQPVVSFLIDVLLNAFEFVWPAIGFIVQMVVDIITGLINGLTNIFNGIVMVVENFGSNWGAVWDGVWLVIQGVVEFIWNLIQATLIGKAFGLIKTGLTSIGSFFSTIWTGIVNFVRTAITNVSTTISNVINGIRAVWTTVWNGIKSVASTVWNAIKTAIETAINAVKTVIKTVLDWIKDFWKNIWDGLKSTAKTVWDGIKSVIQGPINAIKGFINSLKKPIDDAIGWFASLFGAANSAQDKAGSASRSGGNRRPELAAGGILRRATAVIAGEAGPEAYVPLNRPLSQVNPDVRWLSAIAQGKAAAPVVTAGDGGGRVVNIQPGAIVIQGAEDPRQVAYEVLDLAAERIGS